MSDNNDIPRTLREQLSRASKGHHISKEAASRGGKKSWAVRLQKAKEAEAKKNSMRPPHPVSGQITRPVQNPSIPHRGVF